MDDQQVNETEAGHGMVADPALGVMVLAYGCLYRHVMTIPDDDDVSESLALAIAILHDGILQYGFDHESALKVFAANAHVLSGVGSLPAQGGGEDPGATALAEGSDG